MLVINALAGSDEINLNYQMLPFAHIHRATGLHAVLKSEKIMAQKLFSIKAVSKREPASPSWTDGLRKSLLIYSLVEE